MQITREVFDAQRRPRFGTANPERMQLAFWEWMIRGGDEPSPDDGPPSEEGCLFNKSGFVMREGILKSSYGPYRARDHFQVPLNRDDGPIWTFDRMGATSTELPDGRIVRIAGEHEDYYDPDFCIYNDVVVFEPGDEFKIYGYPKSVFPPTDFHTAALVGDRILIVGTLGYLEDRRAGHTPVYALHLSDFRIEEVFTSGAMPGWIFEHETEIGSDGELIVRGGKVHQEREGKPHLRRNIEEFALDLRSGIWRQLTDRNWPQYVIRPTEGRRFPLEWERTLGKEDLLPSGVEVAQEPCEEISAVRFHVGDIAVSVTNVYREVEVIIEGELPEERLRELLTGIWTSVTAKTQQPCELELA